MMSMLAKGNLLRDVVVLAQANVLVFLDGDLTGLISVIISFRQNALVTGASFS